MQRVSFSITFKDYIELLFPHATHGVIFSSDGTIWAISEGWTFTEEDGKRIAQLMSDPAAAVRSTLPLGQRTYLVIHADPNSLVARRREFGIMVAKSKMYFVLAFCDRTVDCKKCLQSVIRVSQMMKRTASNANASSEVI